MTTDIKQRAKDIVKSDLNNMVIGTGIFALISILASAMGDGIIASAVSGLISSVAAACSACFYFRAFNRGKSDLYDTYALLTDSTHMTKIISIILAMWLVNTLFGIAATFIAFIPFIGALAVFVLILLVGYLLAIVWYLFVANPDYPTDYYLKGSVKYMGAGGTLLSFIGFVFIVSFVPALIEGLLAMLVGGAIASVLCIPLDAYVNLAIAGYVSSIIPDAWFNGTEIL